MFVGEAYESVATAFLHGDDALLVDTLASSEDATWLRNYLVDQVGATVRVIVATHYMSDHLAGLRLYPDAEIVAQRLYSFTFLSQRGRTAQELRDYVEPTTVFGDSLSLQWGRHRLHLFHNPGKTVCTVNIDVPDCDLAFAGDNIVGNIVYLSRSTPDLIDQAIARLQQLQRSRIIGGHIGVFGRSTLANARLYLRNLSDAVVGIYRTQGEEITPRLISAITIESCLAPHVVPTAFEREWHSRNLAVIVEHGTFRLEAMQSAPHEASAPRLATVA